MEDEKEYWDGLKKYVNVYNELNEHAYNNNQTALTLCEQIENETQPQRGLYAWVDLDRWYTDATSFLQSLDKPSDL